MNKRERQQKILSLIQAKPVGTQEDLRALLESAGVPATQSSVSRDLEELGVVKHHGRVETAGVCKNNLSNIGSHFLAK